MGGEGNEQKVQDKEICMLKIGVQQRHRFWKSFKNEDEFKKIIIKIQKDDFDESFIITFICNYKELHIWVN